MVVLHVRFSPSSLPPSEEEEDMEFLYECPAAAAVADVAASVATISGLQARLLALSRCLRERCTDERAAAAELERALSEAEAYASKEQVRYNRFLSPHALRNHIKNIEKAAATALVDFPEAVSFQQPSGNQTHLEVP